MKNYRTLILILLIVVLSACNNGGDDTPEEESTRPVQEQEVTATSQPAETNPVEPEPEEPAEVVVVAPPGAAEEVTVLAEDGLSIAATFYPGAGEGPWPAVILLHMNGGDRSDWAEFAGRLAGEGYEISSTGTLHQSAFPA